MVNGARFFLFSGNSTFWLNEHNFSFKENVCPWCSDALRLQF